ncbi:HpcH/HpaI aldolase family protein [Sediminivirga luteola]|uniref:2,4-dihydroxyhept-2-ene-1,7-dioic acid aldolase n=1 Tax=Sediminivirga luteola TaxID=1774748 RepID=A0A8J2TXE6_9MICO|nr:aldolase/citrate lyase family protein [Sediminivirga luteola]GGA12050.1 2,4-dihydroxyhept-2-ene-1,7-dioic acid aldolase [Sediminivirga luteola]
MPHTTAAPLERLRSGDTVHGMWMMSSSADLARISSSLGYDYVCLDMQHGLARAEHIMPLSDAVRAGGDAMVVARVPDNRFTEIGMLADAGVDAIIVPLVSSAAEARAAAEALDYPPRGRRSWGPTNALMLGHDPAPERAGAPLLFVMIENTAGLSEVAEICRVDGVDGVYIGPSDLALSLGSLPGPEEPATTEAIATILATAQEAGVIPGIHCGTGEEAAARRAQGFRFITSSSDIGAARAAYAADLAEAAGGVAQVPGGAAQVLGGAAQGGVRY